MFDYQVSKHPHFDEACRAFALRHNLVQLAERAGMNVQILRNKLNPAQPHLLTAPEIWLLTDLTEDSTLVDGFLAQIHCLPCVPINEVAKEKLPHYVMSATAEIGRVAAGAVSGDVKTSAGRRDAISSINSVNPCRMNSFRVRWRVCCAPTGGIGNYGRCVANGGKSSCALFAWSAKKHLLMSAMKP